MAFRRRAIGQVPRWLITLVLPALIWLSLTSPASAQSCPGTPSACASPTYNMLLFNRLLGGDVSLGNVPGLTVTSALSSWVQRIGANVSITEPGIGAKCDGVTDDTAAINTALATSLRGTVLVPYTPTGCLVKGTLVMANANVTLAGNQYGAQLVFKNGGLDSLDVGGGSSQICLNGVRDLYFNHSGKTGGIALSLNNVCDFKADRLTINGAWNGIYATLTNNVEFDFAIINANTPGNAYGFSWYSPASAGQASNVMVFHNSSINMSYSGGDGIVLDGFVQTLRVNLMNVLGTRYGLWVRNTAQSTSYYPGFLQMIDFEVDGNSNEGVRIEAGADMNFVNSDIDNCNASGTMPFEVLPDTSYSYTRRINLVDTHVHCSYSQAARINARDVLISGTMMFDTNKGTTTPTSPVLEIGANADRVTVSGSFFGTTFGDSKSPTYGVVIDSGANHVTLGVNNYTGATLGSVNNNTTNSVSVLGGTGFDGNPVGPSVIDNGTSGSKYLTLFNLGTASATKAGMQFATGSSGSFAYALLQDGATPVMNYTTGSGVTGGIVMSPASGAFGITSPVGQNFNARLLFGTAAPSISSGFGTGASIVSSHGTAAFTLNVGTGGTASSGVIGLPTATNGWACDAADLTTQSSSVAATRQTGSSASSVTLTQFNTAMAATAWASGDLLAVKCLAN